MKRYLPLLLLLTSCSLKNQQVINTVAGEVEVRGVEYLVDESEKKTFEEVLTRETDFLPYTEPELNFGHLRKPLWVRVDLKNTSADTLDLYLNSDQFILEDVRFWHQQDSGWQMESSGWGRPLSQRQLPTYLHAFRFSLHPLEEKPVYFRVKNEYQVLRLPLTLFDKQGFYGHHNKSLLMDGLVVMALVTSILFSIYNLIFAPYYRKTLLLYLIYAVNFLVFYVLRVASPAFIEQPYPGVLNYFINIFIFISTYTFLRFAVSFVNTHHRKEIKSITGFIDLSFALSVAVSLFPAQEANPLFFAIKLVFFVSTILYLIWYLITSLKDNVLARIYIVMAMPLILSGLVEGLTNIFGVLKIPNQFFEAFRLSICLEMLFILFAMIYRDRYLGRQIRRKLQETEFKLLHAQIEIQETEQKRIAQDLHDDLGGTLSTFKRFVFDRLLPLAPADDAEKLKFLAKKAGDDLRRISHALMPPDFERAGLVDSVRELIRANSSETRSFTFREHGPRRNLKAASALHIYRIFSEIVQNINKHSKATKVEVQFIWTDADLTLMVEDNGSSFRENTEGLGLKNMRMRTDYLGGSLNFDSNENGSTIILEIPLP